MSSTNPEESPSGAPVQDAAGSVTPRLDPKSLRTALAAVAGIAVIGGGALGFVWLGTAPSGAAAVTAGTAPVPAATGTPSTEATSEAFSVAGRDIFAPTVAPRAGSVGAGTAEDAAAVIDASAAGSGASATSGAFLTTPAGTSSTSRGAAGGGTSTTSGATPVAKPSSSRPPVAPSPATPTPSVSTAPAWEVASYKYTGVPAEGRSSNFVVATTSGHAGYATKVVVGQQLYPAAITFQGDFGGSAWISSDRGVPQGWLVPSGQDVPPAALGKTTGTVRVVGLLSDDVYFVQVDRGPSLQVKVGDKVEGTPFTLEKPLLTGVTLGANAVVFKDGSGISYYGASGAGETDGVSF